MRPAPGITPPSARLLPAVVVPVVVVARDGRSAGGLGAGRAPGGITQATG